MWTLVWDSHDLFFFVTFEPVQQARVLHNAKLERFANEEH
jgi:hypothetical protein